MNRYKIHWQTLQVKLLQRRKKCLISIFKTYKLAMARQKLMLNSPSPPPAQSDQSKPILVIVSIKPLTYQSFRQNHFFPAKFIEQFFIYMSEAASADAVIL